MLLTNKEDTLFLHSLELHFWKTNYVNRSKWRTCLAVSWIKISICRFHFEEFLSDPRRQTKDHLCRTLCSIQWSSFRWLLRTPNWHLQSLTFEDQSFDHELPGWDREGLVSNNRMGRWRINEMMPASCACSKAHCCSPAHSKWSKNVVHY